MTSNDMDALIRAALANNRNPKPRVRIARPRVFVSFDFDHDRTRANFLVNQLRASPRFAFEDWSLKEAAPEASWIHAANRKIARSNIVVVLLGTSTCRAQGVKKEVAIARAHGKSVCQLVPASMTSALSVPNAGRCYRWTHDNLGAILADVRKRGS